MTTSLRVLNNCAIGGCPAMNTRSVCPECSHWTPSRQSKYYSCNKWWSLRVKCDLPTAACNGCAFHMPKGTLRPGRPNDSGIDWTDPEQVREYYRHKQQEFRRRQAGVE